MSYSHDSIPHGDWVERLAQDLVKNGVDAILDRWHLDPGQEMTVFMERIRTVDRVLCVCTSNYVQKANAPQGGVGYERMVVTAELLKDLGTTKFVPLLREGRDIPGFMGSRAYIDLREDAGYSIGLERLLRAIHQVPHPGRPPLGGSPFISQTPSVTSHVTPPLSRGLRKPTKHKKYDDEERAF